MLKNNNFLYIAVITLLIAISVIVAISSNMGDEINGTFIITDLHHKGENSTGAQEFMFSVINEGKSEVKLEFPTYLEYNFCVDYDSNIIPSGSLQFEHKDLKIGNPEGRTVVLKPNEKLGYRILIKNMLPGKYLICIASASGYGGDITKTIVID